MNVALNKCGSEYDLHTYKHNTLFPIQVRSIFMWASKESFPKSFFSVYSSKQNDANNGEMKTKKSNCSGGRVTIVAIVRR